VVSGGDTSINPRRVRSAEVLLEKGVDGLFELTERADGLLEVLIELVSPDRSATRSG
jgi:hypothetical protein